MSIESLTSDLKQIANRLSELPDDAPLGQFLKNELLPWCETLTQEIGEMDDAVFDLAKQSEGDDILDPDTAAVFAAIITSGTALVGELATRVGNDRRLLAAIEEFRAKAREGTELLEAITIESTDDDDDDADDDEETDITAPEGRVK